MYFISQLSNQNSRIYIMASQVAHIIYAQKYFEKHNLSPQDKEKFVAGCVFPDIRRIDPSIKRKDTHLHFDPVDFNFENLNPFESGWKFHLYCDMKREEILNKNGFYSQSHASDLWNIPSKLFEDEMVYKEFDNWEKFQNYFNNIPFIETLESVTKETFGLWYAILGKYIEKNPDNKSIKTFVSKLPSISPYAEEIIKTIDQLRKNGKVVEILKRVKDEIV